MSFPTCTTVPFFISWAGKITCGSLAAAIVSAEALLGKTRNTDAVSYTDNYVFSPTLVNQTRVQFSRLTPAVEASGGRKPVVLITLDDPLPASDPDQRSGTLVAGSSTSGATDRRESRAQVQEILSWVHGAHSLKFGGDVQYIRSTFIDLADISGTFSFANATDFIANAPSRFRQNFQSESTQTNTYMGFFIQDEWRLRSNLVFSYGLRYENENIIRDRNNWGPRVSVAYDPFKDGKTVIRFGAGLFTIAHCSALSMTSHSAPSNVSLTPTI